MLHVAWTSLLIYEKNYVILSVNETFVYSDSFACRDTSVNSSTSSCSVSLSFTVSASFDDRRTKLFRHAIPPPRYVVVTFIIVRWCEISKNLIIRNCQLVRAFASWEIERGNTNRGIVFLNNASAFLLIFPDFVFIIGKLKRHRILTRDSTSIEAI